MDKTYEKAVSSAQSRMEETLKILEKFVRAEGSAEEYENMLVTAEVIKAAFEEAGFECRLEKTGDRKPPVIIGHRGMRKMKPVILSGHYDTVFPAGSFGEDVFRLKDGILKGPGVLDMKGGLCAALMISRILDDTGYGNIPLKIVIVGDEENSHDGALSGEILLEECRGADCAFNFEIGGLNGEVVTGRKGACDITVKVTGVSAHPGNAYKDGRNAIEEAAYEIIKIQNLTPDNLEYTLSTGLVKGGTAVNVIPSSAEFSVDIRYKRAGDLEKIIKAIKAITDNPAVDGTKSEIKINGNTEAFEETEKVLKLYDSVVKTAEKYGMNIPQKSFRGGASDASIIAKADIPVLCGCGLHGLNAHSKDEYAIAESLEERAIILALTIIEKYQGRLK